jgi:outer membrane protein OmpA-like peptidoglycan-associated protein
MKIRVLAMLGCVLMMGSAAFAQDSPKVEVSLDYSHMWFTPQDTSVVNRYSMNGGGGGLTYYFTRSFGFEADFQDYASDTHTFTYIPASAVSTTLCPTGCSVTAGGSMFTFNFGPVFKYRAKHFEPFVEGLVGGARTDLYSNLFKDCPSCITSGTPGKTAFDVIVGGGVDIPVSTHVAIRLLQVDYVWTHFNNSFTAGHSNQNNLRVNAGIVFRSGSPKPKAPDTVTANCSVDKSSIVADSGDMISATASGSDTYSHPINYTWTATGGKVDGSGPQVRWSQDGAGPGTYTISAHLDDGHTNGASCSSDVTVQPKPVPPPPTMSCSADPSSVQVGARSTITATVNDSAGTPLTYAWQANSGQVVGTGASVQFDSTGLAAGDYTVTGRVTNGSGAAADCSATVTVQAPPPPPQASKIGSCNFKAGSSKLDNVCKRVLDDAAVRLQNDPKATVVLVGYADPSEKKPDTLSKTRGDNAVKYLSKEKGVADSRTQSRSSAGTAGAGQENYRVDVMFVPDGATF